MILKFECKNCNTVFESEGEKKEWQDGVYGSCFKYVAECPDCGSSCNEYRAPKTSKAGKVESENTCGGSCCCGKN